MRTKSVILYSIDELSPEAKETALETFHYWNVEAGWCDWLLEQLKEELAKAGYRDAEISYTGFYSQGDGASFTCPSVDLSKFIKDKRTKLFRLAQKNYIYASIERVSSSYYSHEGTCKVTVEWDADGEIDLTDEIREQIQALEDIIESNRLYWCKKIYTELKEQYEYQTSDKAITESLLANEIEFLEDGTRF